ncbi:MAG: cysteine desulfurase family protein [Flavobacteriaceae bacterium]|nr:cysteine desulfurase family protein [Flavobacteriaceae bacterium]
MNKIYLDNAATTAIRPEVIEAITDSMKTVFGNPSSIHQFGRSAKSVVETARKNIANHLNVSSSEIYFTAGGSEANNLILWNAVVHLGVKRIITSKIEHHAVLHKILALKSQYYFELEFVQLDQFGQIDLIHLNELLEDTSLKTLVSLMYVNNEIGNILDINKVSVLCKQYNALFHSDTVQGIGHFNIDLQKTPIDFITASAHKFHGPKGVGFLYVKKGISVKPMLIGGEQEKGLRAGTENIHSILGMEKALTISLTNLPKEKVYIQHLKTYFINKLKEIPGLQFNGISTDATYSSYHILNVRFPIETDLLLFNLDLKGIAVSGGSACQSGAQKGSHVLGELLHEKERNKASIRFSFSYQNTIEEIDYTILILKSIITT